MLNVLLTKEAFGGTSHSRDGALREKWLRSGDKMLISYHHDSSLSSTSNTFYYWEKCSKQLGPALPALSKSRHFSIKMPTWS